MASSKRKPGYFWELIFLAPVPLLLYNPPINLGEGNPMLKPKPEFLKKLFPWEQKALKVNGRTMAYIDEGDAEARPVLLLSGNPTWGFLYRDFIEPLTTAGFRAIAPDWVGCGYSDHPRVDASLTLAHHIAENYSLPMALSTL